MKVSDARRYHEIQARRFLDSARYRYLTSAGYEVRSIYELIVAEGLISNSIDHKYEPMVWLHNRVCIPDFIAKAGEKHVFIEVTGMKWHVKYRQLKLKLVQLLETV
jgi:predicted nuclease of restriction endonuclease-like RecB superfamily